MGDPKESPIHKTDFGVCRTDRHSQLIIMSGVSYLELPGITLNAVKTRCRGTALEDVEDTLASTRVSPLSIAKIYNIFPVLSSIFMKFYAFHKERPLFPSEINKSGPVCGTGVILSGETLDNSCGMVYIVQQSSEEKRSLEA